ncbi:MAG: lipid-binding SYLF domain-containing protein [Vicinamibacterales bacterium]
MTRHSNGNSAAIRCHRPRWAVLPAGLALAVLALAPLALSAQSEEARRVTDATTVLSEIMDAGDKAVPASIMEKAEGIAVFPSLVKAGFIVGGQRGHGILSVRGESGTWSAPAFLTITGGSVGLQIGAQAVDLVLVIQNRRGLEQLVSNQFKIGADASVAAGPVGRDAAAATDIQMRAQILSYSRSRGLFAGVTLNGSTINQDRDANERFYGQPYRTGQIVFDRLGGAPAPVAEWRDALVKYANPR